MIIYHLPDGEIWNAIYNKDVFGTSNIENTASVLSVDEIQENRELCKDLAIMSTYRDINGLGRWYIENGQLFERDDWEPFI